MTIFSFFDCSSPLNFLLIEFHCTFSISYKIHTNYVYYSCMAVETSFFRSRFTSFHTRTLFLPSSSVSLSYFIFAVPILNCFGKYLCMSSSFPITILNGTLFFSRIVMIELVEEALVKN